MDEMELNTLIEKMPIGTPVRYISKNGDHDIDTVTRSLPWRSEAGHVVVMIKGKSGYVAVSHIRFRSQGEIDDSQLPEWYQMLKEVFGELNVFSNQFYEDMNCANVLMQARYAAIRDKAACDE